MLLVPLIIIVLLSIVPVLTLQIIII